MSGWNAEEKQPQRVFPYLSITVVVLTYENKFFVFSLKELELMGWTL